MAKPLVMQNDDMTVVYDTSLDAAASRLFRLYADLRQELEEVFLWDLDIRPQVVLVKNSQAFQKLSRNDFFVAFAVPAKNLIVIDYSRMNQQPFSLRITFKHELCHLLLHRHIDNLHLAKWFEEGICQWSSEGIGEIYLDKRSSGLDAAIMTDSVLPLRRLANGFPRDKPSLMLAYEQSKSVVNYLERKFGKDALLDLLGDLKNGETLDVAALNSIGLTTDELEKEWLSNLKRTPRWLVYLADHLYGILFFLAALMTIFAFVRKVMGRKAWEGEETNND
jgi:hypothetical protein